MHLLIFLPRSLWEHCTCDEQIVSAMPGSCIPSEGLPAYTSDTGRQLLDQEDQWTMEVLTSTLILHCELQVVRLGTCSLFIHRKLRITEPAVWVEPRTRAPFTNCDRGCSERGYPPRCNRGGGAFWTCWITTRRQYNTNVSDFLFPSMDKTEKKIASWTIGGERAPRGRVQSPEGMHL